MHKIPIALSVVGLVLIIGGVFSSGLLEKPPTKTLSTGFIKVDISGAVLNPNVYKLQIGSRVEDGIKIAGGFNSQVNKEYVSRELNLSAKLIDGQKIYIPFEGELVAGVITGQIQGNKVGLNSASSSKLEALPGIGPATALKIISMRPYADTSELLSKKVVTRGIFEKIKDLIDLN